jgi:hypothetical protein
MGPTATRRRRLEVAGNVSLTDIGLPVLENGAEMTTVDHADIRGLGTACLGFVVELPRAKIASSAGWRDPSTAPQNKVTIGSGSSFPHVSGGNPEEKPGCPPSQA